MAFKPRTRSQRSEDGVISPSNLIGLLRQTDLNQSNDKGDIALFQFLDTQVVFLEGVREVLLDTFRKSEKIDLSQYVTGLLPIVNGGAYSGTYTPVLTNVANLTASTANKLGFYRVGNVITVFGKVNVQTTGAGATQLRISLPFTSFFQNDFECGGTACCPTIAGEVAAIIADVVNFEAEMQWVSSGAATFDMFFNFSYQLVARP